MYINENNLSGVDGFSLKKLVKRANKVHKKFSPVSHSKKIFVKARPHARKLMAFPQAAPFLGPVSAFRATQYVYRGVHGVNGIDGFSIKKLAKKITKKVLKVSPMHKLLTKAKLAKFSPGTLIARKIAADKPKKVTQMVEETYSEPETQSLPVARNPAMLATREKPSAKRPATKKARINSPVDPITPESMTPTSSINSPVPISVNNYTPAAPMNFMTDKSSGGGFEPDMNAPGEPVDNKAQLLKIGSALAVVGGLLYVMHKRK